MELTDLERDFLRRLIGECWVSPPMFDHEIVARLVELGFVKTEPLLSGMSNTPAGRVVSGWPGASFATVDRIADRTRQICSQGTKLRRNGGPSS